MALSVLAVALFAGSGNAQQAALADASPASPVSANNPDSATQDIVVTGSRIARSGFSAPTPVTVVGATALQQFSQTNVADSLNRLPAFRPEKTPATAQFNTANIGGNNLDLRGLGPTRTLTLVDGRRFVPNSIAGTVDLNLVPSLLVSRAEVVTGGASAAYGSDAVAGVVNIILDHKLEGLRAQIQYGESQRGDGKQYTAAVAGGMNLGSSIHVIAAVEYERNEGTGDCQTRAYCAAAVRIVPTGATRAAGVPANIITSGVRDSFGAPGGLILTGPLKGTQFAPNGAPIAFNYGQYVGGLFMVGGSGDKDYFGGIGPKLVAETEHLSTYSHADIDLGGATKAFVDLSYGHSRGFNYGPQTLDFFDTISTDNPFVPAQVRTTLGAGQTFGFGKISNDLGYARWTSRNDVYRVAAGVSGKLFADWTWDAYYQYGHTDYRFDGRNQKITANWNLALDAVTAPNGTIVCRSTLANPTNGCSPLNLFGEGAVSQDAKRFVLGSSYGTLAYDQHVAAANVQGSVFALPGGDVKVAAGVEYRHDQASGTSDAISKVNGFFVGNQPGYNGKIGKIGVYEGYVEVVAPLLRDLPLVKSLELNGAARRTHYDTSGSVTTWKIGGVYQPVDWLRLRATRSRDIRAPNIGDLFSPLVSTFRSIINPTTLANTLVPAFTGGNTQLKPEVANTLTAGGSINPLRGLNFSADFYQIKMKGAIASIGAQTIVNRCFAGATEFCSAVVRDSSNNVTLVYELPFNLNRQIVRGIDFELSYRLPLDRVSANIPGALDLSSLATYTKDLITIDSAGPVNRAGQTGRPGSSVSGVPHWIVYNTLSYTLDRFTAAMSHRYIEGGLYDASLIGPEQAGYSPTLANSVNTNHVDGRHYFDLTLRYLVGRREGRNVEIYGTVSNLFDRSPPAAPSDSGGTNNALFDVVGRAFTAGAKLRF